MSTAAKKRVVYAALLALSLWPAVHIGLVQQTGLSSWKLAGWGMYATPRLRAYHMNIYGRSGAGAALQRLHPPSPALQDEASEFLERYYRWLSTLARPTAVAEVVFADMPAWRDLELHVFEPILNPSTAFIEQRRVVYAYSRESGLVSVTTR